MSALLNFEQQFYVEECCNCGAPFCMTVAMQARKRQDKTPFFCPNGHPQSYTGKTDAQKVREEMQAKIDMAENELRWAREQSRKDAKTAKDARNKLRLQTKRVEAGVCIHCNRTFKQLAAHMKGKHGEELPAGTKAPQ